MFDAEVESHLAREARIETEAERYLQQRRAQGLESAERDAKLRTPISIDAGFSIGWARLKGWVKLRINDPAPEQAQPEVAEVVKLSAKRDKVRWLKGIAAVFAPFTLIIVLQLVHPQLVQAAVKVAMEKLFATQMEAIVKELDQKQQCQQSKPIINEEGRHVGFHKLNTCPDVETSMISVKSQSVEANRELVDIASSVEGYFYAEDHGLCGTSPWDLAAALFIRWPTGTVSGGSTLPTQVTRQLDGNPSFGTSNKLSYIKNLWRSILYSRCEDDKPRMDAFIVENQPAVAGAENSMFGKPLTVSAASWMLFGHSVADTSRAQKCLLAAAGRRHIIAVSPETPAEKKGFAAERLAEVKARAHRMCESTPDVFEEIDAFQVPVVHAANSVSPISYLDGARVHLSDEIKLTSFDSVDQSIKISLSEQQPYFAAAVTDYAHGLSSQLSRQLCIPGSCTAEQEPADLLITFAEHTKNALKTRLVFSNRHRLFTGPLKETTDGLWISGLSNRPVGSLNKQVMVATLENLGITTMCNKEIRIGGRKLSNPKGAPYSRYGHKTCGRQAYVPSRDAYSHSMNLPFIHEVSKNTALFSKNFKSLGFDVHAESDGASLANKAVFGFGVTAPPTNYMRLSAALFNGVHGKGFSVSSPTLISNGSRPGDAPLDHSFLGRSGNHLRLSQWLNAPIESGTLIGLGGVLKKQGCDWRGAVGKSGTSESTAASDAVRDVVMSVSFSCSGRSYSAFLLVGSPAIDVHLGEISTKHLIQLFKLTLPHLLKRGNTYV